MLYFLALPVCLSYAWRQGSIVMFAIVVPGKVGSMSVRYASATDALKKYREMEADGLINIDLRDAKGEPVGAFDLAEFAKVEAEDADRAKG